MLRPHDIARRYRSREGIDVHWDFDADSDDVQKIEDFSYLDIELVIVTGVEDFFGGLGRL